VSLTSCYRYILELPVNTLNAMLRAALSEDDPAGIMISRHWEDIVIGDKTADVDVRPTDLDTNPPAMTLTATDLGLSLHLRMRAEVKINELPDLDLIVYTLEFDLPGSFLKDASTPPKLVMQFPAVTAPDLNLAIIGGEIILTPELVEPRIHEVYDSDPSLGHSVTNESFSIATAQVTSDIYDDEVGDVPFRGSITVEVTNAATITIVMPGHLKGIKTNNPLIGAILFDSDMTLRIAVGIEMDQAAGELRVKLSAVDQNDVDVVFVPPVNSLYSAQVTTSVKQRVADKINNFPDQVEAIPTEADVRTLVEAQLVDLADDLIIPLFTPASPGPGEVDMTTFVPTTLAGQALALQLEPLGIPCDAPDMFAQSDGFSIAIAAVKVNEMMQVILDNNEGDRTVQGYDMTVNDLTGVLENASDHGQSEGHVWIQGNVDVEVDCWFDPNIDFEGPIFLDPSMDGDGNLLFTARAGGFTADDPCCADVDPADIADLIEGEQSTPVKMPTNFANVGELTLGVTSAVISSAGIVVHGTLVVVTSSELHASAVRKTLIWFNEMAGGS
jgi:hypothetical protein